MDKTGPAGSFFGRRLGGGQLCQYAKLRVLAVGTGSDRGGKRQISRVVKRRNLSLRRAYPLYIIPVAPPILNGCQTGVGTINQKGGLV